MIVDAHQHFWTRARGDYAWLDDSPPSVLHRDYGPDDYRAEADAEIVGTIVVQAAPTAAETDFLCRISQDTPWILGVVGWADLSARDGPETVSALANRDAVVGLRPMLQDLPDRAWVLQDRCAPALETMAARGLVFDALVREDQIDVVTELARRHPGLTIVLDHCGKPDLSSRSLASWSRSIEGLAECGNVHCKLSGLVTQGGGEVSSTDLEPYVNVVVARFGAERLLWGSDWPVVKLVADHADWLAMTRHFIRNLPESDQALVLGLNAIQTYGLTPTAPRP